MTLPICILLNCMKSVTAFVPLVCVLVCSLIRITEGLCLACLREMRKLQFLLTADLSCCMEVNKRCTIFYFSISQA